MEHASSEGVDLGAQLHMLRRRWLVILVPFVAALCLAVLYVALKPPVWRVTAKLQFGTGMNLPLREVYKESSGQYVLAQMELLGSETVKQRVLKRAEESGWSRLLPEPERAPKLRFRLRPGEIVEMTADGKNPDYLLFYANAVIQETLALKEEQKGQSAEEALSDLTQQISQIAAEMRQDEARLAAYERRHSIIGYGELGNLAARQAEALRIRLSDLATQRKVAEMQMAELESGASPLVLEGAPQPVSSETSAAEGGTEGSASLYAITSADLKVYRDLLRQKSALSAELEKALSVFRETHPKVVALKQNLADIERQIQQEVSGLRSLLESRLRALKMEETAVRSALKETEARASSISGSAAEYENLKKEIERKQKLYLLLVERAKEIDLASGSGVVKISQLEAPHILPEPVSPRRKRTVALAILIGLGTGLGLAAMLEYLDDTIRSEADLKQISDIPLLSVIPRHAGWEATNDEKILDFETWTPALEAFRRLRTNILFLSSERPLSSLAVTSSVPQEGKTQIALNLAVSFAYMGTKTLLVDADLRRGILHSYFGAEKDGGVSTVLSGQRSLEESVVQTRIPNLSLLPCGESPPNPVELLSSVKMRELLARLSEEYQRIIIDTAPVIAVPDGVVVSLMSSAALFVVRGSQTSRVLVRQALRNLADRGALVAGVVLNNVRPQDWEYRTYPYRYGYTYGTHRKGRGAPA